MVSPGFTILFYLMMQQRMQKTRFLNVGHTRKSQIADIIEASWHNDINCHHVLLAIFKQKKKRCIVVCQYKVLLIDYCTVIIILVRNRYLSIKQE